MKLPARSGQWIALVTLVTLVTLGVAWMGRISEGRRALADADAALSRNDVAEAILSSRIAAEARCPGCTAPEAGFAKLEKIARDAEARGDDASAVAAWRATRAALLATTLVSTTSERRTHADLEIARFAHRIDAAAVAAGASPTPAAAEVRVRAALTETDVPGGTTFAIVGLGGVVFLVAAARIIARSAKRGRTDLGLAAAGAALAAAGVLFF